MPVPEVDGEHRELYREEARLGRLPLAEAFAYLAALEPRLTHDASHTRLTEPWARTPHAILRTDLAMEIVDEFEKARRERMPIEDDPTPFVERPRRAFSGTVFSFGQIDQPAS